MSDIYLSTQIENWNSSDHWIETIIFFSLPLLSFKHVWISCLFLSQISVLELLNGRLLNSILLIEDKNEEQKEYYQ